MQRSLSTSCQCLAATGRELPSGQITRIGLPSFSRSARAIGDFAADQEAFPRKNAIAPSELDATFDIGGRIAPFELHVAYERDMPIATPVGEPLLVQHFVMVYFNYGFELLPNTASRRAAPRPPELDPDGCD